MEGPDEVASFSHQMAVEKGILVNLILYIRLGSSKSHLNEEVFCVQLHFGLHVDECSESQLLKELTLKCVSEG